MKTKKGSAGPYTSETREKSESPKISFHAGKGGCINHLPPLPQAKQSTNSLGHYGRLTRAVFTD